MTTRQTEQHSTGGGVGAGGADGAPQPRPRRSAGAVIALVVSVFGEILITVGLILALFVVYSLWWTNVIANREAAKKSDKVREHWAAGGGGSEEPWDPKDGVAFLHVPAMGKDYQVLIVKGTGTEELNKGVAGYYTEPVKAAMPWEAKGNFTLAAHRDGHGAKFHKLNRLDKGDAVVVETKDRWYVYKVFNTLPETSKFNTGVLQPVPEGSGKKKAGRYITLTTCTPVYTSRHRLIVWGELVRTEKVDARRTLPAELR